MWWRQLPDYETQLAGVKAERDALMSSIKLLGSMSHWDKEQLMKLSNEMGRLEHLVEKQRKDQSNG